jgi:hypothetical protein
MTWLRSDIPVPHSANRSRQTSVAQTSAVRAWTSVVSAPNASENPRSPSWSNGRGLIDLCLTPERTCDSFGN